MKSNKLGRRQYPALSKFLDSKGDSWGKVLEFRRQADVPDRLIKDIMKGMDLDFLVAAKKKSQQDQ